MNNPPTVKTCTRCHTKSTHAQFHKNGPGLRSQCKPCVNTLARMRYNKKNSPSPIDQLMALARLANSEPLEVYGLRLELGDIAKQARKLLVRRTEILRTIDEMTSK